MKAFLIDPDKREVREVDTSMDFEVLYKLLGCQTIEPIYNMFVGSPDVLYADEDARLKRPMPKPFMTPHGPIFGKALLFQYIKNKEHPPALSLNEVRAQVFFPGEGS